MCMMTCHQAQAGYQMFRFCYGPSLIKQQLHSSLALLHQGTIYIQMQKQAITSEHVCSVQSVSGKMQDKLLSDIRGGHC